jgi:hypothetical protein
MKLPKLRHSSSSAVAAAAADVSIVKAFSSISSLSSVFFIFVFLFGGTGTGRESTLWFLLVSAMFPSAALCSLLTVCKISAI